jgi:hypothetical protein
MPPELIQAHKQVFATDIETRKKQVAFWEARHKLASRHLKLAKERLEEALTRKLDADYKSQQQTRG